MSMQEFMETIEKNLIKNGFPQKKVAFPLEKLYEEADKKGLSFNKVRESLQEKSIYTETNDTKIIFSSTDPTLTAKDVFKNVSSETMRSMEEEMGKLSPEQIAMAQEMLEKMSPEEKEALMAQAASFFQSKK